MTTPTQLAIITAAEQHGPATAARIAELSGLAYSTVTAQLRKLAAAGLLCRDANGTWTAPSTPAVGGPGTGQSDPPAAETTGTAAPEAGSQKPEPHICADPPAGTDADEASSAFQPAAAVADSEAGPDDSDDASTYDGPAGPGRRPYRRSGKPPRARHQLRGEVRDFLSAHSGEWFTPYAIAKQVDASDGAVANACDKLILAGILERHQDRNAFRLPGSGETPAS